MSRFQCFKNMLLQYVYGEHFKIWRVRLKCYKIVYKLFVCFTLKLAKEQRRFPSLVVYYWAVQWVVWIRDNSFTRIESKMSHFVLDIFVSPSTVTSLREKTAVAAYSCFYAREYWITVGPTVRACRTNSAPGKWYPRFLLCTPAWISIGKIDRAPSPRISSPRLSETINI